MAAVARLERHVAGALRRVGYSGTGASLVVAVSGGPDSSALLHCLHRLRDQHGLLLHVAHLNHDFRGAEAEADAQFVAALARQLGLPATVGKRDSLAYERSASGGRISSFEQAAREMRYSFLALVAKEVGAAAVAVGHTADDQAETVLLHVIRGAGLHGLRGMSELSTWPWPRDERDLRLFRPLLQATKAETVAFCRELGCGYREDSSNLLTRFTRNRVRQQLLPLMASEYNPKIGESLVRLARTASLELDYLEKELDRVWPEVALQSGGAVCFDRRALASLHPALQRLVLRRGYAALAGDTRRLGESHLSAMAALAADRRSGRSTALPLGLRLHSVYDHTVLCRDSGLPCPFPPLEGAHPVPLPTKQGEERVVEAGGWRVSVQAVPPPAALTPLESPLSKGGLEGGLTAFLDRRALGEQVHLRTRRPGDRFQPLGMAQAKKLQDFFTDSRVPRDWRDQVPLLVSEGGIAWVVGWRIAHWAKVRAARPDGAAAFSVTFEQVS
ncbi:MAG: tRNA lysidine(34) synthetase TilS [Chloroflexota bacterium]